MDSIKDVQDALCEVRKAHRIIYAYQKRMMDIVRFIGKKLNFPTVEGYKWFSNAAPRKIYNGTWAWDYIYTYLMEYYLGEQTIDDDTCTLGIIQYSDTGSFENEKSVRTNITSFASEEESESKFLLVLEVRPKERNRWWNIEEIVYQKEYASHGHTSSVLKNGESVIVLYSVPIAEFIDERSAMNVLKNFCSFCEREEIVALRIH